MLRWDWEGQTSLSVGRCAVVHPRKGDWGINVAGKLHLWFEVQGSAEAITQTTGAQCTPPIPPNGTPRHTIAHSHTQHCSEKHTDPQRTLVKSNTQTRMLPFVLKTGDSSERTHSPKASVVSKWITCPLRFVIGPEGVTVEFGRYSCISTHPQS